jgi:hypothetical protein
METTGSIQAQYGIMRKEADIRGTLLYSCSYILRTQYLNFVSDERGLGATAAARMELSNASREVRYVFPDVVDPGIISHEEEKIENKRERPRKMKWKKYVPPQMRQQRPSTQWFLKDQAMGNDRGPLPTPWGPEGEDGLGKLGGAASPPPGVAHRRKSISPAPHLPALSTRLQEEMSHLVDKTMGVGPKKAPVDGRHSSLHYIAKSDISFLNERRSSVSPMLSVNTATNTYPFKLPEETWAQQASDWLRSQFEDESGLRPAGRIDVLQLSNLLDAMLRDMRKSMDPEEYRDEFTRSVKQLPAYDFIMHEIIRHVSVHCVERGQLLSLEVSFYRNCIDFLIATVLEEKNRNKQLHDEVEVKQKRIEGLENALDENKLAAKVSSLKAIEAQLEQELDNVTAQAADLDIQRQLAKEELIDREVDLQVSQQQLRETQQELTKVAEKLAKTQLDVKQLNKDAKAMRELNQDMKRMLQQANMELDDEDNEEEEETIEEEVEETASNGEIIKVKKKVGLRFDGLLKRFDGSRRKLKPVIWIVKLARSVYDKKIVSDATRDSEGEPHIEFPEFMVQFLKQEFRLRSLMEQNAWDIQNAVKKYRRENLEIETFDKLLSGEFSNEKLNFLMMARSRMGKLLPGPGENIKQAQLGMGTLCVPLNVAVDAVDALLATLPVEKRKEAAATFETMVLGVDNKTKDKLLDHVKYLSIMLVYFDQANQAYREYLKELYIETDESGDGVLQDDEFLELGVKFLSAWSEEQIMELFNEALPWSEADDGIDFPAFIKLTEKHNFLMEKFAQEQEEGGLSANQIQSLAGMVEEHWKRFAEVYESVCQKLITPDTEKSMLMNKNYREYKRFTLSSIQDCKMRMEKALSMMDGLGAFFNYRKLLCQIDGFQSQFQMETKKLNVDLAERETSTREAMVEQRDKGMKKK